MLPNPWVILGVVVAFIAVGIGGFFYGRHYETLVYEAAAMKAEKQVIAEVAASDKVTETVSAQDEQKQVEIRTVTQTIVKWKTRYVTKDADSKCVIPTGFVLMHDASARNQTIPDTAGQSNDAPTSLGLSTVAETVASNYGTCNETRQRLIDLQGWITQQSALWGQATK